MNWQAFSFIFPLKTSKKLRPNLVPFKETIDFKKPSKFFKDSKSLEINDN